MLAEHLRCKRLSTNIDKCPPSETHFCGYRTDFLKNQMKASKLTDPVKLYAVSSSRFDYARTSYSAARGRGQRGKSSSRGKSAYKRSAYRPAFKSGYSDSYSGHFEDANPSTSKAQRIPVCAPLAAGGAPSTIDTALIRPRPLQRLQSGAGWGGF